MFYINYIVDVFKAFTTSDFVPLSITHIHMLYVPYHCHFTSTYTYCMSNVTFYTYMCIVWLLFILTFHKYTYNQYHFYHTCITTTFYKYMCIVSHISTQTYTMMYAQYPGHFPHIYMHNVPPKIVSFDTKYTYITSDVTFHIPI